MRDDLTKHGAQRHMRPMLHGDRNQCPTCGELFNSTRAFDSHRTGDFTARRCLSVSEMEAKGMVRGGGGFWVRSAMSDDAKRAKREGADAPPHHHHDATSGR